MASIGGPSNPPTSPPPESATASSPRPIQSRNLSVPAQQHLPTAPSALRQAELPPPSPDDRFHRPRHEDHDAHRAAHGPDIADIERDGIHPHVHDFAAAGAEASDARVSGEIDEPVEAPTVRSRLLEYRHRYLLPHNCGQYNCNHGAFSPRPRYRKTYDSISSSFTGRHAEDDTHSMQSYDEYGGMTPAEPADGDGGSYQTAFLQRSLGDAVTDGLLGKPSKKSKTHWLARRHGVKSERWMYVGICTNSLLAPSTWCNTSYMLTWR